MIEAVVLDRPGWLLALIPLWFFLYGLRRRRRPFSAWKGRVDPPLLKALEVRPAGGGEAAAAWWLYAAGMHLAVFALAGPGVVTAEGRLAIGPALLLVLLPLAALAFRRGWLGRPQPGQPERS